MQCPRCGLENTSSSIYCEECGTPLNVPPYTLGQTEYPAPQTDYSEYNAPPPPPLNGNNAPPADNEPLPPPPPIEYDSYAMQPQAFTHQKITSRPGLGIFSAILYFIGALIAAFGLLGTMATFGTDPLIKSVGFLLSIALFIASIFVFVRIRRRFANLQSGCERLRIYRKACGKSRLWEKHVRPNTHGTVEGRPQGTRKIPLAKVGIPSAFRRREDVKVYNSFKRHRSCCHSRA